jgi:hypothetical protein
VQQDEKANRHQAETEERVAAAVLTEGYLADMLPSVLEGLKEAGYFIDDNKVGNVLMPCVMTLSNNMLF